VLQTQAMRYELSSLPGYDASSTGKLIGDVNSMQKRMNNMLQTDLSKIKYYGGKNEWIRVETYRRS
jgi:hypothetical protein